MSKRPKSHYKDPNRRSNWMKNEQVSARDLNQKRTDRFDELMLSGETEAEALARALEIIPKSR
jgi:hypothetical protein